MNEEGFRKYLLENKVEDEILQGYFVLLREFQEFLSKEGISVDSLPEGKINEYTEYLISNKNEKILEFLRALISYSNFIENYDLIIEIIDIAEAYNAMDNLYLRIGDEFRKEIRDEIFSNLDIPPLGAHPDKKPAFTEEIMKRMEAKIGEEKTIKLLAPCLHGRPVEPIKRDREDFLRLDDIDEFLKLKRKELIERLEKHQKEGTLEYAQYVDKDVVEFVRNNPTISPGKRDGNKIIATKIPYQVKRHLTTDDEKMKRYYSCYCSWVRGAMKKGEEKDISSNFCHCSAGFIMQYWEIIFDQPVKVEPSETALTGALLCTFEIDIPEEFQK
ncbi:MAG: hypothetical protein HGN29_04895 [Asgard group archaeon]|nr:hypothetical protein [Asgard group archaeon]